MALQLLRLRARCRVLEFRGGEGGVPWVSRARGALTEFCHGTARFWGGRGGGVDLGKGGGERMELRGEVSPGILRWILKT